MAQYSSIISNFSISNFTNQICLTMLRSLFLSAFLFFQFNLIGQVEFSPPGAEWCYSAVGGFQPNMGFYHLAYTSDTTIQNKQCKILTGIQIWGFPNNCCDTLYKDVIIHQSVDSVYAFRGFIDDFIFLFRNNLDLDETIHFPELFSNPLTVESVDTVGVNSATMLFYELPFPSPSNAYIIDRAGPNLGYFDHWGASCLGWIRFFPSLVQG